MSIGTLGPGGLDYLPCRYGASKTLFRGPKRSLDAPYVAFLGGSTTYGKFVERPYCNLIEEQLGIPCVNFGCMNGGIDIFAGDPFLLQAAGQAKVTVLQMTSPRNMSNRFYKVHPRRNDRFVEASALLRTIYREVDFAEFNFTNHMLQRLEIVSPDRFASVMEELRSAWIARMRLVLGQIRGKIVLLWASEYSPDDEPTNIDADPAFLTRQMLDEISPFATELVEVVASPGALAEGTTGMVFADMDAPAAKSMLGPQAHCEIADTLLPVLQRHM